MICDGEVLLGWIGGYRTEQFDEREREMLHALIPALQRRLRFERHVREAELSAATITTLLEAIPMAAFVVTMNGRIRWANRLGRHAYGRSSALSDALSRAVRNEPSTPQFDVTRLDLRGSAPHWIALLRPQPTRRSGARLDAAATRWQLTPRETQILARIGEGDSNKTIAVREQCAVRTVELHVTNLMRKAGVDKRSELLVKLFELIP